MLQGEIEELATEVRRRAGLLGEATDFAPAIALRLLGPRSVARVEGLRTKACIARIDGAWRIYVRAGLEDVNFVVAHELGHWALRELAAFRGEDEEVQANRIAAAIVAPPAAVRRVARASSCDRAAIHTTARTFDVSKTSAHLRLAEVLGDERAVVTKSGNVLVRSRGAHVWLPEATVAIARARRRAPGVVKARLSGGIDHGRVALRAVLG